jgi:hypothetical protein
LFLQPDSDQEAINMFQKAARTTPATLSKKEVHTISTALTVLLTAIVALLAATPAFADAPPRVRGVVMGVNNDSIAVKQRDGSTVTLKTGADTAYAYVVPSSLDAIKVDDFVGTAVKGPINAMVAVELVIIPESMRAGRISYYGWDPLPDLPPGKHPTPPRRA